MSKKNEESRNAVVTEENKPFILIYSDGYEISTESFDSYEEAKNEMDKRYNDAIPEEWGEEWEDQSGLYEDSAILYEGDKFGCEGVYVWKIIQALPNKKPSANKLNENKEVF